MKRIISKIAIQSSHHLMITLISFIVLFDMDGGFALGMVIWTATPPIVSTIAGILGNLLWMYGLLLWIIGITIFVIAHVDDIIDNTTNDAMIKGKLASQGKMTLYEGLQLYSTLALGIFAIGSGFWFSGTGITVLILGALLWRRVLVRARDTKLKELKLKGKTVDIKDLLED